MSDNELLPNRLNGEPVIFRGCTLSELMALSLIGAAICLPLCLLLCALLGVVMMGVGIGLLSVIAWVLAAGTLLQQLKRGRPVGYYALKLRLMAIDAGLIKNTFICSSRVWSVGRTQ